MRPVRAEITGTGEGKAMTPRGHRRSLQKERALEILPPEQESSKSLKNGGEEKHTRPWRKHATVSRRRRGTTRKHGAEAHMPSGRSMPPQLDREGVQGVDIAPKVYHGRYRPEPKISALQKMRAQVVTRRDSPCPAGLPEGRGEVDPQDGHEQEANPPEDCKRTITEEATGESKKSNKERGS